MIDPRRGQPLITWWDKHPDRTGNDYRTNDDKRTENEGFQSETEYREYLDLLLSAEEQGIENVY